MPGFGADVPDSGSLHRLRGLGFREVTLKLRIQDFSLGCGVQGLSTRGLNGS